jgi:two-component system nitrate/nitrite sensor histidine kinase NarX
MADVLPRLWEVDQVEAREQLQDLRLLARGALAEMRTLLVELRPDGLTDSSLAELLHQLGEATTARTRLPVSVTATGDGTLPGDVQIALYRIAQEALNNATKHARASSVAMSVRCDNQCAHLEVCDDGKGFDLAMQSGGHFGLKTMTERAETIGALLTLDSAPGQGTQVRVSWAYQGR